MMRESKLTVVVGTKRSGMGAVELLVSKGARVLAMDADPPVPETAARLAALGVEVVPQAAENIPAESTIVLSPGVPADLPMWSAARARRCRVIGEVELAGECLRGPVIGITGSNGKTTTTALTGHLLSSCGIACQMGGNIGTAVTALVETSRDDQWNVLELSSFQLETIDNFHAHIGACLNLTPDHLDRHHTFEAYAAAKRRLFETQAVGDFAVLNYDDPVCRSFASNTPAEVRWFSSHKVPPRGACFDGQQILIDAKPVLDRSRLKLRGRHNVENAMAALLMAHLAGANLQALAAAIETFPGVEHRIEFVRDLDGVAYYNDSKATNVDAALKAIDAFDGGIWIILGGKDKGASYAPLAEPLRIKGRAALLIGAEPPYPYAAAPKIREQLTGVLPLADCGTLRAAVEHARAHAQPGEVVLLAPACASFDQYQSYEHRGRDFKQIVGDL